jgi:Flp pilus assembly protein TadG
VPINSEEELQATKRAAEAPVAGAQDEARPWEVVRAAIEDAFKAAASMMVHLSRRKHGALSVQKRATEHEKGRWTKRAHDERGMVLHLMVILLVPLGLLLALFMDAGRLYVMRGRMQVAADAAALAAASGFIDGDVKGDSVEARAAHYVAANPIGTVPATLESLIMDSDTGTLSLVLSHQTGSLLLAPGGITIRIRANARVGLVQPDQVGRPIPKGNAFGWWKQDKTNPGGSDSGRVWLGS